VDDDLVLRLQLLKWMMAGKKMCFGEPQNVLNEFVLCMANPSFASMLTKSLPHM
jgi:hypothetical protein